MRYKNEIWVASLSLKIFVFENYFFLSLKCQAHERLKDINFKLTGEWIDNLLFVLYVIILSGV